MDQLPRRAPVRPRQRGHTALVRRARRCGRLAGDSRRRGRPRRRQAGRHHRLRLAGGADRAWDGCPKRSAGATSSAWPGSPASASRCRCSSPSWPSRQRRCATKRRPACWSRPLSRRSSAQPSSCARRIAEPQLSRSGAARDGRWCAGAPRRVRRRCAACGSRRRDGRGGSRRTPRLRHGLGSPGR